MSYVLSLFRPSCKFVATSTDQFTHGQQSFSPILGLSRPGTDGAGERERERDAA